MNVVSEQCGDQIAGHLRVLSSQLLAQINCTKRKRQ